MAGELQTVSTSLAILVSAQSPPNLLHIQPLVGRQVTSLISDAALATPGTKIHANADPSSPGSSPRHSGLGDEDGLRRLEAMQGDVAALHGRMDHVTTLLEQVRRATRTRAILDRSCRPPCLYRG